MSMGQMRLVVLARHDMHMLLGNAAAATVATGVAGVGSNKGAVAISCQVWGNELCFVNAHLAAHQSKVKERNKMYRVRPLLASWCLSRHRPPTVTWCVSAFL